MKTVWILATPDGRIHEKVVYETAALAMTGLTELKSNSFAPDNLNIFECWVVEKEDKAP